MGIASRRDGFTARSVAAEDARKPTGVDMEVDALCHDLDSGEGVEALQRGGADPMRGVTMAPGAVLTLLEAETFTNLSGRPSEIAWKVRLPAEAGEDARVAVHARGRDRHRIRATLFECRGAGGAASVPVTLDWPALDWSEGFDLVIENDGAHGIELEVGPPFNPRLGVAQLLRGTGVEVGPGMNPFVRPAKGVDVTYLEAMPAEEWRKLYDRHRKPEDQNTDLWELYVIGDAQKLDGYADGSLDFVFCSHVFEHLMNPVGVLSNWSARLRPGGAAVCVVPDARNCFDLRQPLSMPDDWMAEHRAETWEVTDVKYEKWIRYTAPYGTVEDLKRRRYSVHTHYYSPASIQELGRIMVERGAFDRFFVNEVPNNKDFAFVLTKDARGALHRTYSALQAMRKSRMRSKGSVTGTVAGAGGPR